MYTPGPFLESRQDVLHAWMRQYSFAMVVSQDASGTLVASHLPFLLDESRGEKGTLLTHLARPNPQWQSFDSGNEALVIFQGPHTYVSPRWYKTQPSVPTWNYLAVHAYGTPRVMENSGELRRFLEQIVATYEAGDSPWRMEAAPETYIDHMMNAVVGVSIEITRIEGKLKMNQNRSATDRKSVIESLRQNSARSDNDAMARANDAAVADLMERLS